MLQGELDGNTNLVIHEVLRDRTGYGLAVSLVSEK